MCIVNYNDEDNIIAAVDSLYSHKGEFDLYIVDNASKKESIEKLERVLCEKYSGINFIELNENKGFGAGHNAVLDLLESDYHVVMNPDILLKTDVIAEMTKFFDENEDIGIACPATYYENGEIQLLPKRLPKLKYLLAGRLPVFKNARKHYVMADEDLSKITEVDFVTGCFMFMRTDLFKKVGGFDTRYFMYFEDADLTREIKKYKKAVYYPYSQVIHGYHRQSKGSAKFLKIHISSMFKYFSKWRNN